MLTDTDREVFDAIETFKVMTTKQIFELFYRNRNKDPRYCRDRMQKLYQRREIKRDRSHIDQYYAYFFDRPGKQMTHKLILVDFYVAIKKYYRIYKFLPEFRCDNIRADAYIEIVKEIWVNGKLVKPIIGCFVEIHRNNSFDQEKYETLYKTRRWKNEKYGLNQFPKVIIVTDKKVELKPSAIEYKIVNTTFDKIYETFN